MCCVPLRDDGEDAHEENFSPSYASPPRLNSRSLPITWEGKGKKSRVSGTTFIRRDAEFFPLHVCLLCEGGIAGGEPAHSCEDVKGGLTTDKLHGAAFRRSCRTN